MSEHDFYELGKDRGSTAANYAVAYENAERYAESPGPTDKSPLVQTEQQRWDYERGFDDGWNAYMNEDYPE